MTTPTPRVLRAMVTAACAAATLPAVAAPAAQGAMALRLEFQMVPADTRVPLTAIERIERAAALRPVSFSPMNGRLEGELRSAPVAPSDFLVRSDPTLAPVRPVDGATVAQSPPEFSWPPQNGRNTYEVILRHPDGREETRTTPHNWLLWDQVLRPGRYSWRVKVSGAIEETSQPRAFTITPDAVPFVVPSPEALLRRALDTPRPRTWSRDRASPLARRDALQSAAFRELRGEVDGKLAVAVQPEPASGSDNSNYEDTVAEQKRTLASALAWSLTHQPRYGDDAVRRMLAQAAWSTTGAIAYKKNDMANRNVAWTLALAYDWAHDRLTPPQKQAVLAAIRARTQPMFEDVVSRLAAYPYDSHANITLTIVAAIGVLTAGEIPEAQRWVREALPLAVVWTSPWGWSDGGFANGTAQLFWDTGSLLPAWHVLRNAAGVDLGRKEWVRNLSRFMAYFVPPGAPSGVFGDGHELALQETWSRVGKATARFAGDPLGLWYASSLGREDAGRIELMFAPAVEKAGTRLPAQAANDAYFPSVGWVAMHSRLDDPMRTSVYFKSSPYGSYNHSHADQNAFVIHHRGERLAVSSGYYDGYQTAHWRDWYKQTRAANAITFDGGHGQGFNGKEFAGAISRFESTGDYALATGDAQAAYGGALTRAQRSIVYLRPNLVLVHDSLASQTPRTWEWNLHAVKRMTRVSDKVVQVRNGEARMCVEMVVSPEVLFGQTDRFTAPPAGSDRAAMPDQWHGTFTAVAKSPRAEFIALLRIGTDCKPGGLRSAIAVPTRDGVRIEVDGNVVSFGRAGPRVERVAKGELQAAGSRPAPGG